MKKFRFKQLAIKLLSGVCIIAVLSGCGGANKSERGKATNDSVTYSAKSFDDQALWEVEGAANSPSEGASQENYSKTSASKRKLIKNVSMNVETQEYETLMNNLLNRVKEMGGYVQNMESYNGSNYGYNNKGNYSYKRNANLTVRIPQQNLDQFVNSVSELGNVTSRRENVEDVTLQYVDVQSHKDSLKVEQARLLELLERAESLEDVITLENRLTSVRYQIESMESTLRTYDDLVDYSTVNLRIDEVEVYTPVEEKKESNWERMVNGFVESLTDIRDGAINFGIWFVVNLPYLIIWAIVIAVVVIIFKKIKKGKRDKKSKKTEIKEKEGGENAVLENLQKEDQKNK